MVGLYFFSMKVRVAKSAGFCVGVKRAVELVLRLADEHRGRRIFTYGPLIHNPQTVKMLEEKGIMVFGEDEVTPQPGDIVVIRSHGVAPAVMEELSRKNYEIFDATCPKVAYVHRIAREYSRRGYAVIIVGDENHAEVIGIRGEVEGDGVAVVNSPEQVESLPEWEKVVVIAQTTMDVDTFNLVVAAVEKRFPEVVVKNTLCSETSYRQREIKELAADSDAFVVIGGKNSANTKRLFQLAKRTGLPTFWVETADELNPQDFRGIERVAVVAGASTPHWIIDDVVERLETMHSKFLPPWRWRWLKSAAYFVLRSNILASLAAGSLTFVLAEKTGLHEAFIRSVEAFSVLFISLNLYEYREWQGLALMDPSKVQFVRQNRKFSVGGSMFALVLSFALSIFLGIYHIVFTILVLTGVMAYFIFPVFERVFPAFIKDAAMLGLWILLIWGYGTDWNIKYLFPIAMLGALQGLVMGLKELEMDRILQRKSITAALGEKLSVALGLIPVAIGILSVYLAGIWHECAGFVIGFLLMWFLAALVGLRIFRKGNHIETFVNLILILTALLCA
ncbi:4-hydroxy-3-methylbut-2-enyl diphosphate reductase [bacterium]|nr:4-hydroxy-3-methylbut-2-enyl diphosphate reductase [bacterium]